MRGGGRYREPWQKDICFLPTLFDRGKRSLAAFERSGRYQQGGGGSGREENVRKVGGGWMIGKSVQRAVPGQFGLAAWRDGSNM